MHNHAFQEAVVHAAPQQNINAKNIEYHFPNPTVTIDLD